MTCAISASMAFLFRSRSGSSARCPVVTLHRLPDCEAAMVSPAALRGLCLRVNAMGAVSGCPRTGAKGVRGLWGPDPGRQLTFRAKVWAPAGLVPHGRDGLGESDPNPASAVDAHLHRRTWRAAPVR